MRKQIGSSALYMNYIILIVISHTLDKMYAFPINTIDHAPGDLFMFYINILRR